jgi:hypothetical protein
MRNLIEGDMKEAHDRTAEQDVETEDFVRFVEYAYRGDYTAPSWILEEQSAQHEVHVADVAQSLNEDDQPVPNVADTEAEPVEVVEDVTEAPADDVWGDWSSALKKDKKKKKKTKSKASIFRVENFNKRDYLQDGDAQAVAIASGFTPLPNTAPEQSFMPVFLAYVHLYSFAEMRLIHGLKALTLHKLHCTLRDFTLYSKRVGDIVELARRTYENTPNRTADGTVDKLRVMVVDYIVCESAKIGESKEFRELLEEGGEFVSDFWDVVSSRII